MLHPVGYCSVIHFPQKVIRSSRPRIPPEARRDSKPNDRLDPGNLRHQREPRSTGLRRSSFQLGDPFQFGPAQTNVDPTIQG